MAVSSDFLSLGKSGFIVVYEAINGSDMDVTY